MRVTFAASAEWAMLAFPAFAGLDLVLLSAANAWQGGMARVAVVIREFPVRISADREQLPVIPCNPCTTVADDQSVMIAVAVTVIA